MAKAASTPKRAAVNQAPKYRKLDFVMKKNIIEEQLTNQEAQHFLLQTQLDIYEEIATEEQPYDGEITQLKEQIALNETRRRSWETKLLDIQAEIDNQEKDQ